MSEDNDVIFRQVGRTAAPEASGTPIPEVEVEREVTVDDHLDRLLAVWDTMDNAAQAIATSLPDQMTASAERLESARLKMREVLQAAVLAVHKSAKETSPKARRSDTLLRVFQMDDIAYFDPDKSRPLLAADALAHAVVQPPFPAMDDARRPHQSVFATAQLLAPHRFEIGGTSYIQFDKALTLFVNYVDALESAHGVAVAGARSIGKTDHDENYVVPAHAISHQEIEADPHRFAVVSSDFSRPFLLGAYETMNSAEKAQCGSPEKWFIYERVTDAISQHDPATSRPDTDLRDLEKPAVALGTQRGSKA
jgi:hypothetical protein